MVPLIEWEYICQVITEILANVYITRDPLGLQNHPVFISPVPKCIIGADILGGWSNIHGVLGL